jgi:hypothetical protein
MVTIQNHLSGIWHCRYWYPSNNHSGEDVSEYLVKAHQKENKLAMTSLPTDDDSYMTVKLSVVDDLATGSWLENTAPEKEFHGMIYSGALQLIISQDEQRMDGKWVGNGREKLDDGTYEQRVYCGRWELVRAGEEEVEVTLANNQRNATS